MKTFYVWVMAYLKLVHEQCVYHCQGIYLTNRGQNLKKLGGKDRFNYMDKKQIVIFFC